MYQTPMPGLAFYPDAIKTEEKSFLILQNSTP